jgi:hypothetical protein
MGVRIAQETPGFNIQGQIDDFKNDVGNVRIGRNGLARLLSGEFKTVDGEEVLTGLSFSDPSKSGGKWNFTISLEVLRETYGADVISELETLARLNQRG